MEKQIDLDCPPGDPRPGDLIADVIKGTGLELRDDSGYRFFGWWSWDYKDVPDERFEKAAPVILKRIRQLYDQGIIRGGSCR